MLTEYKSGLPDFLLTFVTYLHDIGGFHHQVWSVSNPAVQLSPLQHWWAHERRRAPPRSSLYFLWPRGTQPYNYLEYQESHRWVPNENTAKLLDYGMEWNDCARLVPHKVFREPFPLKIFHIKLIIEMVKIDYGYDGPNQVQVPSQYIYGTLGSNNWYLTSYCLESII